MFVHFQIHRWVLRWIFIGIVCGVVAVVNILSRNLTRTQEEVLLAMGVMHWVLGGIACYFYDSIQIQKPTQDTKADQHKSEQQQSEWHEASDFLLPGGRRSLLPPHH
jgi:hypothetical protein